MDIRNEIARQKLRLEKLTSDSTDARAELANNVYPLMNMLFQELAEGLIGVAQRVDMIDAAIAQAQAEDDEDELDEYLVGLDFESALSLDKKVNAIIAECTGDEPNKELLVRALHELRAAIAELRLPDEEIEAEAEAEEQAEAEAVTAATNADAAPAAEPQPAAG